MGYEHKLAELPADLADQAVLPLVFPDSHFIDDWDGSMVR